MTRLARLVLWLWYWLRHGRRRGLQDPTETFPELLHPRD